MDQELQKIITDKTRTLPPHVKTALEHVDVPSKLTSIFANNSLRVDQSGALETEVILTILGIQPVTDFTKNIEQHVGVSKEAATKIANEVNETIFKAIRMDMASQTTGAPQPNVPQPHSEPPQPPANLPTGATPDPVQQKLEGSFRLAPDAVVIKKPTLSRPIEKGTYPQGADPYREPIQ